MNDDELLDQKTAAQRCHVSVTAFQKWGLTAERVEGRRTFYRWSTVRAMADLKRSARTRLMDTQSDPLTSVHKLSQEIGRAADEAFVRDDLDDLQHQLRRMQGLVCAAGLAEEKL